MGIGSIIGGITAPFMGPLGTLTLGAGGVADELISRKVKGVPTPGVASGGSENGLDYRSFLDQAFPGTTPWERLGASTPAGAVSAASMNTQNEVKMQLRELDNRKELAEMNNRASIISAASPMGVKAVKSALDSYSGNAFSSSDEYDNFVSQGRQRLAAELPNIKAETRNKIVDSALKVHQARSAKSESEVKSAEAALAKELADARLSSQQTSNIYAVLYNFNKALKAKSDEYDAKLKDWWDNRGSKPSRLTKVK